MSLKQIIKVGVEQLDNWGLYNISEVLLYDRMKLFGLSEISGHQFYYVKVCLEYTIAI